MSTSRGSSKALTTVHNMKRDDPTDGKILHRIDSYEQYLIFGFYEMWSSFFLHKKSQINELWRS